MLSGGNVGRRLAAFGGIWGNFTNLKTGPSPTDRSVRFEPHGLQSSPYRPKSPLAVHPPNCGTTYTTVKTWPLRGTLMVFPVGFRYVKGGYRRSASPGNAESQLKSTTRGMDWAGGDCRRALALCARRQPKILPELLEAGQ